MTKKLVQPDAELYGAEKLSDLVKKYGDNSSIMNNHDLCSYRSKTMKEQSPYICEKVILTIKKYNPEYGDDRICRCGHQYYRHFDTYEDMYACGCKYCECNEFTVEK